MRKVFVSLALCGALLLNGSAYPFGSGSQTIADSPPLGTELDAAGVGYTGITGAASNVLGRYVNLLTDAANNQLTQTVFLQILLSPLGTSANSYLTTVSKGAVLNTATFTNSSANIGVANTFSSGDQVYFTNSGGGLPSGFSANTAYFVIATSLSSSNIQVSATRGGSAITASSGGTGTQTAHTLNPILPTISTGSSAQFAGSPLSLKLPLTIPSGVSLWAADQAQSGTSPGADIAIKLNLYTGGFGAVGHDSLNANTATSRGSAVVPGNGSKGSYTQLIASTSRAYKGIYLTFDTQGVSTGDFNACAVDIEVGASVLFPNNMIDFVGTYITPLSTPYLEGNIAAGSSISSRAQCAGAQGNIGVSAYGVY